ncbi:MAG: DUF2726 domain-containing protein [Oscillatoriales cyanobacterium SM2_2_1]|nr:DUF2726 domain-containing protein [Oscillatoriales cyanobacterium SM2_2_1]
MEVLIPLTIVVIAVMVIAIFVGFRPKPNKTSDPSTQEYSYKVRGALLTPAEVRFYRALKESVGDRLVIFSKVRVADVLTPETGLNKSHWQRAFNKISAKHFDFVLCDPDELTVSVVIELDDRSHQKPSRMDRDNFLNLAVQSSELKMLRFTVKAAYSVLEIESKIF